MVRVLGRYPTYTGEFKIKLHNSTKHNSVVVQQKLFIQILGKIALFQQYKEVGAALSLPSASILTS